MTTVDHIVTPDELMAYLDGELPPERAASVRPHLSDCAICQALAAEFRDMSDGLRTWTVDDPPETLRAPVVSTTPVTNVRRRLASWHPGLRHAAAAAVVVFAIGGAIWFATVGGRHAAEQYALFTAEQFEATRREGQPGLIASAGRRPAGAPTAAPVRGGPNMDVRVGGGGGSRSVTQPPSVEMPDGPKIVRAVNLTMVTKDFAAIRPAIDRVLRDVRGFIGNIHVSGEGRSGSLQATLRVPADRLDAAVSALRALGHVMSETQSGDDVTEQVRDLEARLINSRNTEKRLTEVLRTRTGDVSDVLQVEREIARVREEIERMDAERTNLERRVAYATITLQVHQEHQATLDMGPLPVSAKIRNAMVDGLRAAFESLMAVALWVLRVAPTTLLWLALLWWPARVALRRGRVWSTGTRVA